MAKPDKICVGAIAGVHGVRGGVRVLSFTAMPDDIFAYGTLSDEDGKRKFDLKHVGMVKNYFIATIKGVSDRTAAEKLKGTKLFISRDVLPKTKKNEYYEADLVGLKAKDKLGKPQGKVLGVYDFGAGSFLEIKPEKGKSFMLPFNDDCVPEIDVDGGVVIVEIPEGWLSEEKPDKKESKS